MQTKILPPPVVSTQILEEEKALYFEEDTRQNITEQLHKLVIENTKSVACLIFESRLMRLEGQETYTFNSGIPLLKSYFGANKVYKGPFKDELVAGIGTAFAIDTQHVLTAAHNVCKRGTDELDPEKTKAICLIFEFTQPKCNENIHFHSHQIRKIKSVVDYVREEGQVDWAILELDKKLEDRKKLGIECQVSSDALNDVYILGHPQGLSMKYAIGKKLEADTIIAKANELGKIQIDAFAGNSGSPIFNQRTHKVVAMLVRGLPDYEYSENGEVISRRYSKDSSMAETCQLFLPRTRLYTWLQYFSENDEQKRHNIAYQIGCHLLQLLPEDKSLYQAQHLLNRALNLFKEASSTSYSIQAAYNQGFCLYHLSSRNHKQEAMNTFHEIIQRGPQQNIPPDLKRNAKTFLQILNNEGYGVASVRDGRFTKQSKLIIMASKGSRSQSVQDQASQNSTIKVLAKGGGVSTSERNLVSEDSTMIIFSGGTDDQIDMQL